MIVSDISNNHVTGLKIIDGIGSSGNIIGSFEKNTGEIKILNLNHTYDELKGKYVDIQNFGKWYVNDLETDEEFTESTLSLFDITHKFDEAYEDTFPFPATIGEWAIWIGNKVEVPLKGTFLNYDLELVERPYLGDKPKYRDAVKIIAKYASGYAQKNYDNTYSIKWFSSKMHEIEDWENFKHGNTTSAINVIVLSTGETEDNVKWPENDPQEPHELRIEDDWINVDRYSINEAIYNQVNGFSYTSISKLDIPYGLLDLRAGEKIKTQDIERQDIETNISKHTLEWQGGDFDDQNAWTSSLVMEELKETSTKLEYANSFENKVLNVERIANKNVGVIKDLVSTTTDHEERIVQNTMDINGIKQTVSNTYDFTRETNAHNQLVIENAQAGILLGLSITGEMELLYPSNDLYPADDLYPLDSYLNIENNNGEIRQVLLPITHLYKVGDTSDEFMLERIYNEELKKYESKCKVIRRITVDSSGNKNVLQAEFIEDLGLLDIQLWKGTNKIYLESFTGLDYSCKYTIINEITDEYVTKKEVETEINQTEESINLSVDKKLEKYSTTENTKAEIKLKTDAIESTVSKKIGKDEVCSSINQSSEEISLKANRFSWESENSSMKKDGILECKNIKITNGDISTNRDVHVGNNLYVGENQNITSIDNKFIRFSDSSYIRRGMSSIVELMDISSRDKVALKCGATEINVQKDQYTIMSHDQAVIWGNNSFISMSMSPVVNSDIRLKTKIKDINVEWINDLKIKEFEYKNNPHQKFVGLIAQDYIDKDYSEIFLRKHGEFYSINYENITNSLIQYSQMLNNKINELTKKMEVLENKIFKNN